MTLELIPYLQSIKEADWKKGNRNKYAIKGNYFFKRLRSKAPSAVHDFLMKKIRSNTITSYRPKLEQYHFLTDEEYKSLNYNGKYNHVYVFEKVEFTTLEKQFEKKSIKKYIHVLDHLHYFFSEIDKAGITYHDVDWDNIGWNKTLNELCVIDLDSMVESTITHDSLSNKGNPLFHQSFLTFRVKYATTRYKLDDIKHLNLCIYHSMFFAFVLGLSQNDSKFNLMKSKETNDDVNNLIVTYINENYVNKTESGKTIDDEYKEALKEATSIVSLCIQGTYKGNPYENMALIANKLEPNLNSNNFKPSPNLNSNNFKPSPNLNSNNFKPSANLNSNNFKPSPNLKSGLKSIFERTLPVGIGIGIIILIFVALLSLDPVSFLDPNNNDADTFQTAESFENSNYKNQIGMEFVKIPSGAFMMGSSSEENIDYNDGPVHEVTIGESFYLGKFEVTQKEWREVMGNDPSKFKGDDLPVDSVSWNDVQEFIKKLNEKEGTDKYRLPSEAEWEYACRAGTVTSYSFGDTESEIGDYAWYNDNSDHKTHPVGLKKPNQWGLYDMDGNLWEMCQDTYHEDYDGAPSDGSAWESGNRFYRIRRGGVWCRSAEYCNSVVRGQIITNSCSDTLGFRILMEC